MLGISIALLVLLMSVSIGADAQMGSPPPGDPMGPGSQPGMNDDPPQGPRWEQQTENKQVEKGLMFRYGKETPETSIEGEDTGSDIGLKVTEIRFGNQTNDLNIQIDDVEWEVQEQEIDEEVRVTYNSHAQWQNELGHEELFSDIQIQYHYIGGSEDRSLEYNITIDDPPGKGNLTITVSLDTIDMEGGCCWNGDSTSQNMERNVLTLRNKDGEELSQFKIGNSGYLNADEEVVEVEIQVEEKIVNSTAALDVNMELPMNTRSASISGSLNILEGLIEAFTGAAEEVKEFVIEHIYFFAGGAAVMVVIIMAGVTIVSKKNVETHGSELDLESNKYFRGPQ